MAKNKVYTIQKPYQYLVQIEQGDNDEMDTFINRHRAFQDESYEETQGTFARWVFNERKERTAFMSELNKIPWGESDVHLFVVVDG